MRTSTEIKEKIDRYNELLELSEPGTEVYNSIVKIIAALEWTLED